MMEFSMQSAPMLLGKITILLISAFALNFLLRRASASVRNILWTAALAGALVLPLLSVLGPAWRVRAPLSSAATSPIVKMMTQPSAVSPVSSNDAHGIAPAIASSKIEQGSHSALSNDRRSWSWPLILGLVWLTGTLSIVVQIAVGLRLVDQAWRNSHALDGRMTRIAQEAQASMRIARHVEVCLADARSGIAAPIMWGAWRPVVLLPSQSTDWADECVRAALLHEFAHIQRWDWPSRIATQAICALYWFHPLVWMAARQIRETSERACDDCVLNAGVAPADYAQRLIDVLRSIPEGARPPRAAIAMALPNETEGRIRAVLASGLSRRAITRKWAISGMLLALAIILPISALRLAAKEESTASDSVPTSEIRYAGGGKVQLLGITDYPAPGKTWWNADGKRLSAPPIDPDPHGSMSFTGKYTAREFAFRVTGAPSDAGVTTDVPGETSGGMWTRADKAVTTVAVNALLPIEARTASVRVGLAAGPWETLNKFDPWGLSMGSPSWRGHSVTIGVSDLSLFSGSAGLTVTNTVVDGATRVVAIDQHNIVHVGKGTSSGVSGTTQMQSLHFEGMKISDIKKIVFQARPYEWREFKNLPLEPQK
ncbi:MAG: M56 family metallopeptidase [Capsulimonas sp.]|uniref:M56 family metallopeptidase n=1 Tax=Capsulimonas sp. TaxID=2494211 RepID=UPI0032649413